MATDPLTAMSALAAAPLAIGLTGGIASGKSAAAEAFARLGVEIIDADRLAREVVAPGEPLLARVVEAFGPAVLEASGALNRPALRALVFADDSRRRRLESLLHPAIRARMEARLATARGPYAVLAIPLLVEGGGARARVDRVLVVDCPETLQLERLMRRDAETDEGARRILATQATRDQRLAAADDVLSNDGTLADLAREVALLDRRYRALAAERSGHSAPP